MVFAHGFGCDQVGAGRSDATAYDHTKYLAHSPNHLGARVGITAVLHTWGSALTHHPHIHMIRYKDCRRNGANRQRTRTLAGGAPRPVNSRAPHSSPNSFLNEH